MSKVEQLMHPRYEVIADWPNQSHPEGSVIKTQIGNCGKQCYRADITYNQDMVIYPDDFPALFRKLQWWEHRDLKDMPEYVKKSFSNEVIKIEEISNLEEIISKGWAMDANAEITAFSETFFNNYIPATLSDYTQYLESLKK